MRVLRDRQNCACAAAVQQVHGHTFPPMAQPSSLNVVKELLNDLELHLMILVSFGLQVFLLFTAGLRRRGAPHFLRSLIWLAYLLADSVAIFVLGHLAVKASGARHQLLLFWAPFVFLHLGGQQTITAFSMQDNKLWKRHLLEFFSHLGMACYIVSRSSWPDKEVQSAMVFMMFVGYFKYVERTMCLIFSNPERLKFMSGLVYYETLGHADSCDRGSAGKRIPIDRHEMEARLNEMCKPAVGDMQLLPSSRFPWQMVLSSTPLNCPATVECTDALPVLLQEFKQKSEVLRGKKNNTDLCPAYNYVGAMLCAIYENLYTKAPINHSIHTAFPMLPLSSINHGTLSSSMLLLLTSFFPIAYLFLPVFMILMALVLFKGAMTNDHNQIYSLADVIVSYILLIGALILEAASIFAWLSSYTVLTQGLQCGCLTPLVSRVVRYIHSAAWLRRKQWSETLGQHSRIKKFTRREGIMYFVPGCIASCLYNKALTQKPLSEDLKKLVLNKLLDFGIGGQQYWNFASTRGKLALLKRIDLAGPGTHLHKSINNVDFTTSLLIWHIATDICYYREDTSITNNTKRKKKMCQELSYYIMYLVFHCDVLLTTTANIIVAIAYQELDHKFKNLPIDNLSVKQAIEIVFEDEQEEHRPAADMASSSSQPVHQGVKEAIESEIVSSEANAEDGHRPTSIASNKNQPLNHVERLRSTMDTINLPVLPRAREVAKELISIDKELAWDLITDVWLEMLYYVAPRCGGEFHHDHLITGGEFITHVLLLMHELGPFLPPPADLVY